MPYCIQLTDLSCQVLNELAIESKNTFCLPYLDHLLPQTVTENAENGHKQMSYLAGCLCQLIYDHQIRQL